MSHTPGPWEVGLDKTTIIGSHKRNIIAECLGYKNPTGDRKPYGCREANAQLIAQVPEMIERITELEQQVEDLESELASLKDLTQNQGWLHKGLRELREGREE